MKPTTDLRWLFFIVHVYSHPPPTLCPRSETGSVVFMHFRLIYGKCSKHLMSRYKIFPLERNTICVVRKGHSVKTALVTIPKLRCQRMLELTHWPESPNNSAKFLDNQHDRSITWLTQNVRSFMLADHGSSGTKTSSNSKLIWTVITNR